MHPTLCVGQAPANMQQFPLPPSDAFPEVLLRCKAHVHNWVDNGKQRKLFAALKNSGALRMHFKADILFMASLSMVYVHLWPRLKCLFVLKWIGLAPAAAKAFAKEFLDGKHSKWSHVYVPAGIANDTNGTESHNHQIKAGGTGWQLQPLPTFFERIVTFTQSKSAALAVYHHFPKIDKKTMEKAVTVMSGIWLMDDCYFNGETNFASPLNEWNTRVDDEPRRDAVILIPSNSTVLGVISSEGDAAKASSKAIDMVKSLLASSNDLVHTTFDEAKAALTAANVLVEYKHARPEYQSYWCSCRAHQHYGVCEHAIALEFKCKKVDIPAEHDHRAISSNSASSATTTKRGGALTNDTAGRPAPRTPHHSGFALFEEDQ